MTQTPSDAQALAERAAGLCAGIVAHADLLLGDAVVPVLEAHFAAAPSRLRGIRHVAAWDPDMPTGYPSEPGRLAQAAFRAGFKHLARHGLSFDIWAVHPQLGEVLDLGVKAGVVEKSGSWFSYNSQRIGQGRDNAREFLKQNPDMANEIEQAVRKNAAQIVEELLVGPSEEDDV